MPLLIDRAQPDVPTNLVFLLQVYVKKKQNPACGLFASHSYNPPVWLPV